MCSAITHGLLGLAVARIGVGERMPARYWLAAAALAIAPDFDAAGYSLGFGPPGGSLWSHRGLTHSLLFAALCGALTAMALFWRPGGPSGALARPSAPLWRIWLVFTAAMASHGLTDMLTNGGAGIALFSPVAQWRAKWAFRPVEVSPLSVGRFFSVRGLEILWSELRWVLLPAAVLVAAVELVRRRLQMNRRSPRPR